MVSTKVLFDTNILIDYLSGVSKARAALGRYRDRGISIVTWMEVMAGTTPEDEAQVRTFLNSFRILPVTADVAEESVALRRRRKIKLPDAIIQATARLDNRTLLTRNTRDFPAGEPGVSIPYSL